MAIAADIQNNVHRFDMNSARPDINILSRQGSLQTDDVQK